MANFLSALHKFQRLQKFADKLREAEEAARPDTRPLWRSIARPEQLPPDGNWLVWLLMCGRGFGKTRTGAEWVIEQAYNNPNSYGSLIARTAADVRNVMVCGESGILRCARKEFTPRYIPSQSKLVFPNGAIIYTFSSEKPDQIRGSNASYAWVDELAAYGRKFDEVWSNLKFSTRIGRPKIVATTTPRYLQSLIDIRDDDRTHVTYGKTKDNIANLSEDAVNDLIKKYGGTRLGEQELDGQIVADVKGALWTSAIIEACRTHVLHQCHRIVVGVDPAVSSNKNSDDTGIVVCGVYRDGSEEYYQVLEDCSGVYTPEQWANEVAWAYQRWGADLIVAEKNQGGDLVESNLRNTYRYLPIRLVHASKGKATRAEPIRGLYGLGKVSHFYPDSDFGRPHRCLSQLGWTMTSWVPSDPSQDSPGAIDAMVWAMTELSAANLPQLDEFSIPRR